MHSKLFHGEAVVLNDSLRQRETVAPALSATPCTSCSLTHIPEPPSTAPVSFTVSETTLRSSGLSPTGRQARLWETWRVRRTACTARTQVHGMVNVQMCGM